MSTVRIVGTLVTAVLLAGSAAAQVAQYSITDLGSMGGVSSHGVAINDAGQVIATYMNSAGVSRSFLWSSGTAVDLGTLGGTATFALGLNNLGQIVGESAISGTVADHPFTYSAVGGMTALNTFNPGTAYAHGVNQGGVIVGAAKNSIQGFQHAQQWVGGVRTDLGLPPGYSTSRGFAVNAAGTILIDADSPTVNERGFLLASGQWTDLGSLGGSVVQPVAMNSAGDVVGSARLSNGNFVGFLNHNGAMTQLPQQVGPGPGAAVGINDTGAILGSALGDIVMWSGSPLSETEVSPLLGPNPGWQLAQADGINNTGQLLIDGINSSGQTHALLLTPVPEPSTFALCGPGTLILLARRRNLRRRPSKSISVA